MLSGYSYGDDGGNDPFHPSRTFSLPLNSAVAITVDPVSSNLKELFKQKVLSPYGESQETQFGLSFGKTATATDPDICIKFKHHLQFGKAAGQNRLLGVIYIKSKHRSDLNVDIVDDQITNIASTIEVTSVKLQIYSTYRESNDEVGVLQLTGFGDFIPDYRNIFVSEELSAGTSCWE